MRSDRAVDSSYMPYTALLVRFSVGLTLSGGPGQAQISPGSDEAETYLRGWCPQGRGGSSPLTHHG